jgi:hypothetical protein
MQTQRAQKKQSQGAKEKKVTRCFEFALLRGAAIIDARN